MSDLKTVLQRELLEISRSTTSLIVLLFLCAAYPTGLLALSKGLHDSQGSGATPIKIAVKGDASVASKCFATNNVTVVTLKKGEDAEAQVLAKQLDAVVTIPSGLGSKNQTDAPVVIKTRTGQAGFMTGARLDAALDYLHRQLLSERLAAEHLDQPWFTRVEAERVKNNLTRAGKFVVITLPFLLTTIVTVMCVSYAVDSVSGERVRKTWQPLLVSAIDRNSLLWGKLICTVMTAMLGVFVCVGSLLACSAYAVQNGFGDSIRFEWQEAGIALLFALPLAAFLSAMFFFICSCAKSTQEAGLFTTATTMVLTLIPLAAVVPPKYVAPALYMMPVINDALCISESLQQGVSVVHFLATLVSSCALAAVFVYGCTKVLQSETLLWNVQVPIEYRRDYLGTTVALLTAVFLLFFYLGQLLMAADAFVGTIATQLLLFAVPAWLTIKRARLPMAETLSLKRVPWWLLLGAALLAPATTALAMGISLAQNVILPAPEQFDKLLKEFILQGHPLWQTVLAMAITPGICEELLFRGAVFGLLRKSVRPVTACLITGALFGLFHMSSFRFLPTAALGVILCFLTLATGSILPAMALHALHNTVSIFVAIYEDKLQLWYLIPALLSSACGLALIWRYRKQISTSTH
ncbi:MAG TPA: CPBP family glutamic-type intramembrane protease [Planktothrix sp.]